MNVIRQMSPSEVKNVLEKNGNVRLIDVREKWEYDLAKIENCELMPLSSFSDHLEKLKPEDSLIIYCHTGVRSYHVCSFLAENGFTNVSNLEGGIKAWSLQVDPTVPLY